MRPLNLMQSLIIAGSLFHAVSAHAVLSARREAPPTAQDKILDDQIEDLDKQIRYAKELSEVYSVKYNSFDSQIDEMNAQRAGTTITYSDGYQTTKITCGDHDHYVGCTNPRSVYFTGSYCKYYRDCYAAYTKYHYGEKDMKELRKKLSDAADNRSTYEDLADSLAEKRDALLQKAGRALRDPEDLDELADMQKMKFRDVLTLNQGNESATVVTPDGCHFSFAPDSGDGVWFTGGKNKANTWELTNVVSETQELTSIEECSGRLVHPTRKQECIRDIRISGSSFVHPSVTLESKDFPGKGLYLEAKDSKAVLSCLTKRGFNPELIKGKPKRDQPRPSPEPSDASGRSST